LPESYYAKLRRRLHEPAERFPAVLARSRLRIRDPEGAYTSCVDIAPLGGTDDVAFVHKLIKEVGVSAIPGSSFHSPAELGRTRIRFMFAKREETLHQAGERLRKLKKG